MSSTNRITLIQQNDIHGQTELHNELFWQNGQSVYRKCGGLARIATIVRQVRENTGGNCLYADCGDAIHGTAPAQWTEGAALIPPLNALGLDVMTPGNWEFGFGPEVLRQRVDELSFPVLACNVENAVTGEMEFAAQRIFEVGGVRLGVIGLSTPIVTERMPHRFGAGLRFSSGLESLTPHIHALRHSEKVDLVVLLSHLGLAQDLGLVQQVPGIDVVLSGHTHDRLAEPIVAGKTIVIQSGFSGSFLGRLDLEVAHGKVVSFSHALIEVTEGTRPDSAVQDVVDGVMQPHRDRMRDVVGQTKTPLHRMTVLESPMDNFITDAYREWTGTDIAFSHGWRYGAPVPPGPITEGDLWQMIPTNPELFTGEMTGEQIHQLLERSLESVYTGDPLQQKGGYPIRFSGLSAVVRINNPKGARVAQLEIGGVPCKRETVYTVTAAGEQDVRHATGKKHLGTRSLDALRGCLKRTGAVAPAIAGDRLIAI